MKSLSGPFILITGIVTLTVATGCTSASSSVKADGGADAGGGVPGGSGGAGNGTADASDGASADGGGGGAAGGAGSASGGAGGTAGSAGQGAGGVSGADGGSAGVGGAGGAATKHVFSSISYEPSGCLADADCPASVPKCYRMGKDLGLCDVTMQRPAGGAPYFYSCSPPCAATQICVDDPGPTPPVSCLAKICAAPTDCPSGSACVPPTVIGASACIDTKCTSDAQCTDGPEGRCAAIITGAVQSRPLLHEVRCVYHDTTTAAHCQGTTPSDLPNASYGHGYYTCPQLAH